LTAEPAAEVDEQVNTAGLTFESSKIPFVIGDASPSGRGLNLAR
jgi:hypothetical protein